jgi:hypothetical protein
MSSKWLFRLLIVLLVIIALTAAGFWVLKRDYVDCFSQAYLTNESWTSDSGEVVFEKEARRVWSIWTPWGYRECRRDSKTVMRVPADGGIVRILAKNAWGCGCSFSLPIAGYITGDYPLARAGNKLWLVDLKTEKKWPLAEVVDGGWCIDPGTGQERLIMDDLGHYKRVTWCWSPAGDQLLYRGGDLQCYISDPNGKDRVKVFDGVFPGRESPVMGWDAYWSRDGLVYFILDLKSADGQYEYKYYSLDPKTWKATPNDQWGLQKAKDHDEVIIEGTEFPYGSHASGAAFCWTSISPDGTKAVYLGRSPPDFNDRLVVLDRKRRIEKTIADFSNECTP